jgi:hypothetical protein
MVLLVQLELKAYRVLLVIREPLEQQVQQVVMA